MKALLTTILSIAMVSTITASEADWSASVNGLRGRLSLERDTNRSPFLKIFIELQNTSDVGGMRKIRFDPKTLKLAVTDILGKELETANGFYIGRSPIWEPLLLPFEGRIRFRISFPGLGFKPERDRTIIDFGPSQSWVIPEGKEYFLSGEFKVERKEGDHHHLDWSGTLKFPKIKIPTK